MYTVLYTDSALEDLRFLKRPERTVVLDTVDRQLTVEPLKSTRNRKQLNPNDLSSWELRIGAFRVFYDVDEPAEEVTVKAVGWKEHNRLLIRGKEQKL